MDCYECGAFATRTIANMVGDAAGLRCDTCAWYEQDNGNPTLPLPEQEN